MKTLWVLLLLAGTALASPPFNPAAAVDWIDQTVKTDVPKEQRIYLIGPETRVETYTLNGQTAQHAVPVCRIVSAKKVRAVDGLGLVRFGKLPLSVQVYRNGAGPVFATGDARSEFSLVAGDVAVVLLGTP